jgi:hypothetical protein
LEVERRFRSTLPLRRFDTAYIEDRRVHRRLPFVEWDGVRYSVRPEVLGAKLTCRVEIGSDLLEISWGSTIVARHRFQVEATEPVWDPAHRQAAEAIALRRCRPMLRHLELAAEEYLGWLASHGYAKTTVACRVHHLRELVEYLGALDITEPASVSFAAPSSPTSATFSTTASATAPPFRSEPKPNASSP